LGKTAQIAAPERSASAKAFMWGRGETLDEKEDPVHAA
jgi:hypothetical protein